MCRTSLGVNVPTSVIKRLASLQANGATVGREAWVHDWFCLIHNRFSVTSESLGRGAFPLVGQRYVICYDGEVYEFRGHRFVNEHDYQSDVHFALAILDEHGIDSFFADVDFEGTIKIYDKQSDLLYIFVDQLNTHGCFYSAYENKVIMASEFSVVDEALKLLDAPADIPILILEGGSSLVISRNGSVIKSNYRLDRDKVWAGEVYNPTHFQQKVQELKTALINATGARIPPTGNVGVLAGGGVDSSLLLTTVSTLLRQRGQLHRLRVFTLGAPSLGGDLEDNDFEHISLLCKHLGLDWNEHVRVISPVEIGAGIEYLLQTKVYTGSPRLITPNPVRTQVRHTVMMANVLAAAVTIEPDLRVILTGDTADEILAGYNSMHWEITEGDELRKRIAEKLFDLPLNDASRTALASYHGASAVLKGLVLEPALRRLLHLHPTLDSVIAELEHKTTSEILEELKRLGIDDEQLLQVLAVVHPLEIRMPYTSHHFLRTLTDAHVDYTVGMFSGKLYRKFLLRIAALDFGIPKEIAFRKKVPFNEGGRGIRNDDEDPLEIKLAARFSTSDEILKTAKENRLHLVRLGIVNNETEINKELITKNIVHFSLFHTALRCGLLRLLRGNAFRDRMPDAVYSTADNAPGYLPLLPLECTIKDDDSAYSISQSSK